MSKKASKRAKRRQAQGYCSRQPAPDGARDWCASRETRGLTQTTPREFYAQARGGPIREPFYLWELGLTRDCYVERVPRYEPGPVIRETRS